LSTTTTSPSVHSCRSACSSPIPDASNQDGRQIECTLVGQLINAHISSSTPRAQTGAVAMRSRGLSALCAMHAVVPSLQFSQRSAHDRGEANSHLIGAQKCPRQPSFNYNSLLGYVPWRLCFGADVWPRPKTIDRVETRRHRHAAQLLFFRARLRLSRRCWTCPPASRPLPQMATSQPGCWQCSHHPGLKTQALARVR
jgi:hypothetical protein